jgi:hypothetical protein
VASSEARPEEPEPVRLMATAFDLVLDRLPQTIERTDEMRRDVALFIVDQYQSGEHDPDRLSDLALAKLCPSGQDSDEAGLVPDSEEAAERAAG